MQTDSVNMTTASEAALTKTVERNKDNEQNNKLQILKGKLSVSFVLWYSLLQPSLEAHPMPLVITE